jgi:hypothetical protein
MDVEQWWNKPEKGQNEGPEGNVSHYDLFHHIFYVDSSGIGLVQRRES